jgi:hypothetical protein
MPSTSSNTVPVKHTQTAEHELSAEPNVFVEPYRPDLLPLYIQKDWQNGGLWLSASRIQAFSDKMMQPMDNCIYSDSVYPQGFQLALRMAKKDFSVPGYYKSDMFLKGSLVREEYRVVAHHHETDHDDCDLHVNLKKTNPLVDLRYWKNERVSLEALESISTSYLGDDHQMQSTSASSRHKRKLLESQPSPLPSPSPSQEYSDGSLHEDQKTLKLDSPPYYLSHNVQVNSKETASAVFHDDPDLDGHDVHDDHDLMNSTTVAKRETYKTRRNVARLPNALKVTKSIYPGYDIYPSSCTPGKWIASVMFRGSKILIGQYTSQSEAKTEIDKYYQDSKGSIRNNSKTCIDDSMDSSDDELDVLIQTRKRKMNQRHLLVDDLHDNIQSQPVNTNLKEQDIAAIRIEDAVSFAYRNGHIEGTGFSFHEWAKVVVKNVEKGK